MTSDAIELQSVHNMDRLKNLFNSQPSYEPIRNEGEENTESEDGTGTDQEETPFAWVEYCIFVLMGVAMLWAW